MPRATKKRTRRPTGRPSSFRPEFIEQARKLCLLGATDAELADFFGVSVVTLNNWKKAHPVFLASLKAGKLQADAQVAQKLFRRAIGYSHKAVKILTVAVGNNQGSEVREVPYIERYAPDTTACIFWLKNRRPAEWRDRQPEDTEDAAETARQIRAALKAMTDADGLDDAA